MFTKSIIGWDAMKIIKELRRRNVFKVAISYLVLAWVLIQVTDIAVPALRLPEWTNSLVFYFGLLGFPVALFFAWAFELTPSGIKRTQDVEQPESSSHIIDRKTGFFIITMLVIAVSLLVFDRHRLEELEIVSLNNESVFTIQPSISKSISPSIAVLPFVNMSSDPEQEYFSDGISEELLNLLAKMPEIQVVGRTSSFAFKGLNQDLREIGKKLGVDHLLEGSVRKQGLTIRITAQLIRTSDGMHLWSESYTRELKDIFALQDEIAGKITAKLRINLLGDKQTVDKALISIEAHNFYLLGLNRLNKAEYKPLFEARDYFRKAYQNSPSYVDAYLAYAMANYLLEVIGGIDVSEASREIAYTLKMLATLNTGEQSKIKAFSGLLAMYNKDMEQAKKLMESALQQSNKDLTVLQLVGQYYIHSYNIYKSLHILELIQKLDPLNLNNLHGLAQGYMGVKQYDKARMIADKMIEIDPEFSGAYVILARLSSREGNLVNNYKNLKLAYEKDDDDPETASSVAFSLARLGFYNEAQYYISKADELGKDKPLTISTRIYLLWAQGKLKIAGEMAYNFLMSKPEHRHNSYGLSYHVLVDYLLKTQQYQRLYEYLLKESPKLKQLSFEPIMINTLDFVYIIHSVTLTQMLYKQGKTKQAKKIANAIVRYAKLHKEKYPQVNYDNFWAGNYAIISIVPDVKEKEFDLMMKSNEKVSLSWGFTWNKGFLRLNHLIGDPGFDLVVSNLNKEINRQHHELSLILEKEALLPK